MLVSSDWVSSESLEDAVEVVELEMSLHEKFAEESDGGEIAGVGETSTLWFSIDSATPTDESPVRVNKYIEIKKVQQLKMNCLSD